MKFFIAHTPFVELILTRVTRPFRAAAMPACFSGIRANAVAGCIERGEG
jgi:hypothetical protein